MPWRDVLQLSLGASPGLIASASMFQRGRRVPDHSPTPSLSGGMMNDSTRPKSTRPDGAIRAPIDDDDEVYPCYFCRLLRSKNQEGTIFSACDKCFEKLYEELERACR